jgi:hypothetical protein
MPGAVDYTSRGEPHYARVRGLHLAEFGLATGERPRRSYRISNQRRKNFFPESLVKSSKVVRYIWYFHEMKKKILRSLNDSSRDSFAYKYSFGTSA